MTGVEITDFISGALETHHMSIETDIYYFLDRLGKNIDLFNSPHGEIPEAREDLVQISNEIEEWKKELEDY